jgi:hypothetical protein
LAAFKSARDHIKSSRSEVGPPLASVHPLVFPFHSNFLTGLSMSSSLLFSLLLLLAASAAAFDDEEIEVYDIVEEVC